jgi:hypothetical protein
MRVRQPGQDMQPAAIYYGLRFRCAEVADLGNTSGNDADIRDLFPPWQYASPSTQDEVEVFHAEDSFPIGRELDDTKLLHLIAQQLFDVMFKPYEL